MQHKRSALNPERPTTIQNLPTEVFTIVRNYLPLKDREKVYYGFNKNVRSYNERSFYNKSIERLAVYNNFYTYTDTVKSLEDNGQILYSLNEYRLLCTDSTGLCKAFFHSSSKYRTISVVPKKLIEEYLLFSLSCVVNFFQQHNVEQVTLFINLSVNNNPLCNIEICFLSLWKLIEKNPFNYLLEKMEQHSFALKNIQKMIQSYKSSKTVSSITLNKEQVEQHLMALRKKYSWRVRNPQREKDFYILHFHDLQNPLKIYYFEIRKSIIHYPYVGEHSAVRLHENIIIDYDNTQVLNDGLFIALYYEYKFILEKRTNLEDSVLFNFWFDTTYFTHRELKEIDSLYYQQTLYQLFQMCYDDAVKNLLDEKLILLHKVDETIHPVIGV